MRKIYYSKKLFRVEGAGGNGVFVHGPQSMPPPVGDSIIMSGLILNSPQSTPPPVGDSIVGTPLQTTALPETVEPGSTVEPTHQRDGDGVHSISPQTSSQPHPVGEDSSLER